MCQKVQEAITETYVTKCAWFPFPNLKRTTRAIIIPWKYTLIPFASTVFWIAVIHLRNKGFQARPAGVQTSIVAEFKNSKRSQICGVFGASCVVRKSAEWPRPLSGVWQAEVKGATAAAKGETALSGCLLTGSPHHWTNHREPALQQLIHPARLLKT